MPGVRHFIRRCITICWTSLAIVIILFALMVSISRMLIPLVADYRADFEQVASEQLGRTVKVGSINAEWVGLWPRIHLSQVEIQSKTVNKSWLQFSDVWLSIDLLSILGKGYVDTERVKLGGLQLDVHRKKQAEYVINGESFRLDQSSPGDQAELLKWFFSRDRLQLEDCRFSYRDDRYGSQSIDLAQFNFNLENSDKLHHTYGRFIVPGQQESRLSFVMDMQGDMHQPQEVINNFYLSGDVSVSRNMQEWLKPVINLQQGEFSLHLWGGGHLQNLDRVTAELHARDLAWSVPDDKRKNIHSQVDNLQAKIFWVSRKDGWNLDVENFTLTKAGVEWPESEIRLAYQSEAGDDLAILEGTAGFIKLQDVSGLLSENLPQTLAISKEITELDVQGSLHNISFRISSDLEHIHNVYLSSAFNDLGFERWRNLPGARGMDGRLLLTQQGGVLQLESKDTVLDLGGLFKKPLQVRELRGDVYWKNSTAGLELSFDSLIANNDHIETSSRARIIIPSGEDSSFIDMNVDFKNGKVMFAPLYIPRGIMSKGVTNWLDNASEKGVVPSGKMIFHGRSKDFPFVKSQGTFRVDFDVERMQLVYGESWPPLQQVNANVRFKGNSLLVNVYEGEVMKVRLLPSVLKIDALDNGSVLDMNLEFEGKTQQMFNYIHDSPVAEQARDFLANLSTDGTMDSRLKISIPLSEPKRFSLNGRTHFNEGNVRLQKWNREFKQFKGDLQYSYDGKIFRYNSDNMQTIFLGKPAKVKVKTESAGGQSPVTTISLQSRLGLSQLLADFLPHDQAMFSGDSDWNITLGFQDKGTSLLLETDLVGEAIELPDSFAKQADAKRRLQIKTELSQGQTSVIHFNYGEILNTILQLTGELYVKPAFEKGEIRFGRGDVSLPDTKGLVISGRLDSLALNKWLALLPGPDDTMVNKDVLVSINKINLAINRMTSGQLIYNNLSIIATHRAADLMVTVGADEVAGEVIVPLDMSAGTPVQVKLKYLHMKTPGDKQESSVPDPRKLPAFDVVCEKLFLNGRHLGKLALQVLKNPGGLKVDKLELRGDLLEIDASGSWLFKKSWHESTFSVNFSTPKIGEAMQLFDFQPSIDDGEANAQLQASWSGPPHWFEMKRLNGSMHLSISKGQLRDISPGGGRIFGLLSVQTLQRRLSLDFSDLFKKGFGFDRIEGRFAIADGDAFTNDLYLDGPSARIDISGRIGLASEDYDEEVYVTPKLSSSIPILGLAAGPQVAIGLFLTEKILRNRIDKMSRIRYTVTGSWDRPQINKISEENGQADEGTRP